MMNQRKIVAVEGIDGSGKSTLVSQAMTSPLLSMITPVTPDDRPIDIRGQCFPSDGPTGRQVRGHFDLGDELDPDVELDLLLRDMRDTIRYRTKRPAPDPEVLLLDRYWASILAYQSRDGRFEEAELVQRIGRMPEPDAWVYLEIEPALAMDRLNGRRKKSTMEKRRTLEHCAGVYDRFFERRAREQPVLILDATVDPQDNLAALLGLCARLFEVGKLADA